MLSSIAEPGAHPAITEESGFEPNYHLSRNSPSAVGIKGPVFSEALWSYYRKSHLAEVPGVTQDKLGDDNQPAQP